MNLPKKDVDLFYKLELPLLFYTNQKYNLFPELKSVEELKEANMQNCSKINDKLFDNPETINEFINDNSSNYSKEEIDIIKSWNNFIKGTFYIVKHLKKYSIFMSAKKKGNEEKLYAVLGLMSPLEEMVPQNYLPMIVDTVLLPFKNKIIYDGFLKQYNISFGGNYSSSVNDGYNLSKAKYGIIENLNVPETKSQFDIDKDLIKYYLKEPEYYSDELNKLIIKNEENLIFYNHELARKNLRYYKKKFKALRMKKNIWIAMFRDLIISSAENQKILMKQIEDILPQDMIKLVFITKINK